MSVDLLSFMKLNTLSREFSMLSVGSFMTILFFNSKSHLLDWKKYKFWIWSNENLDWSMNFFISKNSLMFGFPNINGSFLFENSFLDNFPFEPIK